MGQTSHSTELISSLCKYVIYLCNAGVGFKVQEYYNSFVNSSNIKTEYNISLPHLFVRSTLYSALSFKSVILSLSLFVRISFRLFTADTMRKLQCHAAPSNTIQRRTLQHGTASCVNDFNSSQNLG